MKGLLFIGAVAAGVLLAKHYARRSGGFDFEGLLERMPEDAPPKWMFRNITAIRDDTGHILELLEKEPMHSAATPESVAA